MTEKQPMTLKNTLTPATASALDDSREANGNHVTPYEKLKS